MNLHLILSPADEREKRAARLRQAGYEVRLEPEPGPELLKALSLRPPDAVVIDLSRAPSLGRDIALALRAKKATRRIPLVLVGGEKGKVEQVKELLPDAHFTEWSGIRSALKHAIAHPTASPVVPGSVMAGYSGTPLAKKLGIKPGMTLALVHAPAGFARTLGELPKGAKLGRGEQGRCGLALWFMKSAQELVRDMPRIATIGGRCPVWIVWPKKRPGRMTGVGENQIRAAGLRAGLVDYKVCSIDDDWSGLLFVKRRAVDSRESGKQNRVLGVDR